MGDSSKKLIVNECLDIAAFVPAEKGQKERHRRLKTGLPGRYRATLLEIKQAHSRAA
jgi:hypothetical protein